jgi:hypothetical protein
MKKVRKYSFLLTLIALLLMMAIPAQAAKVKLNKSSLTLYTPQKYSLKLENVKSSKVKWSSSNKSVVTVSKKGKLRAKKAGKATITAKAKVKGKTKKYKCSVVVIDQFDKKPVIRPPKPSALEKANSQVRSRINSFMKNCRNYKAKTIKKYFLKPSKAGIFTKNKKTAKLMKTINKKYLSWAITDFTCDTQKATVKLAVNYFSLEALYRDVFDDMSEYAIDNFKEPGDKWIYKTIMKYYKKNFNTHYTKEHLKGFDFGRKTVYCTLNLVKRDGKWKIKSMPSNLKNAIHSDYNSAYSKYDW